jgi:hypothetical protein
MKRILMFVLLFAALKVAGQTTGYLRFDTVKIMKQNGTCELYVINSTKDSLGLLTNIGGGLTRFIKPKVFNDSTIIVGLDTLVLRGAAGGSSLTLNNVGTGYPLVATPGGDVKKINNGYGILIDSTTTANTITIQGDTSSTNHLVTQSDLNDAIAGATVGDGDKGDITVSSSGASWTINDGYLPLSLGVNKTVNQSGNNIIFSGGGKVRSDSLSLTKTITPFISGDSAAFSGHSIVNGAAATDQDSTFPSRVGRSHSMFVRNLGIPSSQIWSAVKIQMGWINSGHNAYEGLMPSLNDVRNTNILSAGNRKTINSIVNGMKAMWMNHMAKAATGAGDGSITRSGSWNSSWDASVEAGKKTNAAYTSSAGAYAEYTFSDSTVGVQFMGNSSGGATVVTIAIDGSTVETFDLNNQNDGVSGSYMPTAKFFTGLTNASHTLRVTNTSGDGLMIVDYFTNLRDAASAPPIVFFHEPHLDATGYSGGQASDAAIDTINVKYDSLRNSFPSAYKARTIVARTNTRYVATTSSGLSGDHVHPNDSGHGQIALAERDAVATVVGADSGTIQYGHDGNLYVDAKRIAYQNSVTLQDAINNGSVLNTPADVRGSTFEFNGFTRIGLNFLKIGSTSQGALAHGTLGVQGPLGGLFLGSRTSDTTKGFIYYADAGAVNLYDVYNSRANVRWDSSMRVAFFNNPTDNVFASASATIHIGGNTNGVAGHAPLKINKGVLLATPEPYAVERDSLYMYITDGGGNRDTVATRGWTRTNLGSGAIMLKGTANWTPGSISNGGNATTTVSITGAAVGDGVSVAKTGGYSNGELVDGFVSGPGVVTIRTFNFSGGSGSYSASDYQIIVHKY